MIRSLPLPVLTLSIAVLICGGGVIDGWFTFRHLLQSRLSLQSILKRRKDKRREQRMGREWV
jgi:hypothetical protein